MKDTQERSLNARVGKPPDTKPKHAGGRKPKGYYQRAVQDILDGSAPTAAIILDAHMNQRKGHKSIKDSVVKICFYVIDHAIGKSRLKIEHSGGILTYADLAKSAAELDKKPPDILADVEEIAHKYQEK